MLHWHIVSWSRVFLTRDIFLHAFAIIVIFLFYDQYKIKFTSFSFVIREIYYTYITPNKNTRLDVKTVGRESDATITMNENTFDIL